MSILPNNKSLFDKKFDKFFGSRLENLDLSVINNLPLICSSKLLVILANSFDVDIDGLAENEARELIHSAFELHYYAGTPYILKKALKLIYENIDINEWFDYEGEPYHFKVQVKSTDKSLSQDFYNTLEKNIFEYKNVRSVLEAINIILETQINERYASVFLTGETIEVWPFYEAGKLNAQVSEKYALASKLSECITSNFSIEDYVVKRLISQQSEKYVFATKIKERIKSNLVLQDYVEKALSSKQSERYAFLTKIDECIKSNLTIGDL